MKGISFTTNICKWVGKLNERTKWGKNLKMKKQNL